MSSSVLIFMAIYLPAMIAIQCHGSGSTDNHMSEKNSEVAIYSDNGCWEESVTACRNMFQWAGFSVSTIDAEYINNSSLNNFRLICIPGGDMYQYARDISARGKKKIEDFVRDGGAYIGICGGAYFAATSVIWQGSQLPMTPLGLYQGEGRGPLEEITSCPEYCMTKINITNTSHVITESLPDTAWILYYWGPALIPADTSEVVVLGRYSLGNLPAILAFSFGQGRVFLIGTHPEIEEDDTRDSVTIADELDDSGTDWELMKNAALWCLKVINQ